MKHRAALLLAALSTLIVMGCSAASVVPSLSQSSQSQPPHCVALLVQALTSTRSVNGAWACQAPALQMAAHNAGINNDQDLAKMARQSPVFSSPHYYGPLPDHHGYEYSVTVDGSQGHPLFVWVDKSGHPVYFQYVP